MIKELLNILKAKFPDFRGIYFYGSRARGNNNAESDYDIAAVFEKEINWKFEKEVWDIVCEYMVKNDVLIDCKVYSVNDIQNPLTPLRANVKNEGIYYGI